jgi:predicted Zn finger-like uncharacterized protein
MSIRFACPSCQTSYTVNNASAGKSAECKACGHRMRIPAAGSPARPVETPSAKPDPGWEPVEEERQEPVRRRDDERTGDRDARDDWPAPRRPRAPGGGFRVAACVVWAPTGVAALGVGGLWLLMMKGAESAIQEAAGAAMSAAMLVGVYVVARAATEILGHVGALRA